MSEEDPNFKLLNDYYRKNPPKIIIDDSGIKHWKEVDIVDLTEYEAERCHCNIIHPVESDTWYHSSMPFVENDDNPKIVKKCKKCLQILFLKRKDVCKY